MKSFIVDSSVWIAYFEENKECKSIIEGNSIKTPAVVVAEIAKVMAARNYPVETRRKILNAIFNHSVVLELDFNQAVKAGELSAKEKMPFVDAIVYSYASQDDELVTRDSDFNGKAFTKMI